MRFNLVFGFATAAVVTILAMDTALSAPTISTSAGSTPTTSTWAHDPAGPRYQYDRFRKGCFDEQGKNGFNVAFVGACGDLRKADLEGRDLSKANLRGANLTGANIKDASLMGSDLRGADLRFSNWENTAFKGAFIDATTKLPFAQNLTLTKGFIVREFSTVDLEFIQAARKDLPSSPTKLSAALVALLSEGADYMCNSGEAVRLAIESDAYSLLDMLLVASGNRKKLDINPPPYLVAPYLVAAASRFSSKGTAPITAMVDYLLKAGANPNLVEKGQRTALWAAAEKSYVDAIRLLLKSGAVSKLEVYGESLVAQTVRSDRLDVMKEFIAAKVDLNHCVLKSLPCSSLEIALKIALASGYKTAMADLLMAAGVSAATSYEKPTLLDYVKDVPTMQRLIALGASALKANVHDRIDIKVIDFLLSQGASINSRGTDGQTLLYKAVARKDQALIDFALKNNADLNIGAENTPLGLLFADKTLRDKYLAAFLAAGADPNSGFVLDRYTGKQSLLMASLYERPVFMQLVRAGAEFKSLVNSEFGVAIPIWIRYVLTFASPMTAPETSDLKELLARGADFNVEIPSSLAVYIVHTTPGSTAIETRDQIEGKRSLVSWLLQTRSLGSISSWTQFGLKLNGSHSSEGDPLVNFISSISDLETLEKLGVPLDGINNRGQNALFGASPEKIEWLLDHGVPVVKSDKNGDSVLAFLSYDVGSINIDLIERLVKLGADPADVSSRFGLTLAHLLMKNLWNIYSVQDLQKVITELFKRGIVSAKVLNQAWRPAGGTAISSPRYGLLGTLFLAWRRPTAHESLKNFEEDTKLRHRQDLVAFVKALVALGYDVHAEDAAMSTPSERLRDLAYDTHSIELVTYLKKIGMTDQAVVSVDSRNRPDPNACDFFGNGPEYEHASGGCRSKKSGLVWSTVAEVAGNSSTSPNLERYCYELGPGWHAPTFPNLMREFFTRGAVSPQYVWYKTATIYSSRPPVRFGFSIATGDVKQMGESDKMMLICRRDLIQQ